MLPNGLTPKQNGFVKDYLETGNGTQSILKNYDTTDENTAAMMAWDNLRKPKVIKVLQDASEMAAAKIITLSQNAESEVVQFNASRDILDRSGFKPVEKSESKVQSEVALTTTEELLLMANELSSKIKGE